MYQFVPSKISHQLSKDHKVLKLGGFSLACATEEDGGRKDQIGTYRYMAPEVMRFDGRYSERCDVYSFGEYGLLRYNNNNNNNNLNSKFFIKII